MALFSIENVDEWAEGDFTGALVVAPNALEAVKLVAHLTDVTQGNLKVTRERTAGSRLLWTGFND